ncbi:nucleotidyltransferase domain-containing protein [bacterium]|nr:nucleotidyltransferase domain-containing protein [bacterium]
MTNNNRKVDKLIKSLQERSKELNCLYQIEDLLNHPETSLDDVFGGVIRAIPPGWQYPEITEVKITYEGMSYTSEGFFETPWAQHADITVHGRVLGAIGVYYTREMPRMDEGPFLKEELKLIKTIADRIGHFILHQNLRSVIENWQSAKEDMSHSRKGEWKVVVDLLRKTDLDLFLRITRQMINYLCWNGFHEADELLQRLGTDSSLQVTSMRSGGNSPSQRGKSNQIYVLSEDIFRIAEKNLPDDEILSVVQKWMQEDKSSFLIRTLIKLTSTLSDISDAIRRFAHLSPDEIELSDSTKRGVKVALVRRFLSDQLEFIKTGKDYVEIEDFYDLIPRLLYPPNSHGQLGGKSAGLFLAYRILMANKDQFPTLNKVKMPKTWHITSDGLHNFLHHNNLEEITEQKYKEIGRVRQEYPHIVQLFKNSQFTLEIVQGLSMALDDFGETPLIVRSSSLLEDRLGSAFSGKYTSLFLANQGPKKDRLNALMDAIAEVYSSTFGPDPIEYRAERGLLDFHEEMGIMIQQVVGRRVGKFYVPSFAGVAFSNNEFRWSPRIKREDGLIRLVPGLGTRAVDRLSDDYTILIAPGQPGLRVNTTPDEIIRYSPRYLDVINLENQEFETIEMSEFLKECGDEYPQVENIVSTIKEDGRIHQASLFNLDFEKDDHVVTFEGLITRTHFVERMHNILTVLQNTLQVPVDIEFASDGDDFYLLQCRPQSYTHDNVAMPIPKDIPESAIVFSANRYVSNGRVPDITHVVYVDPEGYGKIENQRDLMKIGRAVGLLNKQLPKRQFILMGPGRWGSRGDIKLGVNVTYSDISNTAVLIEIARQKANYVPDLSFGTHFFQDLVESSIRYLPLYPDQKENIFNEHFLKRSKNILSEILPDYSYLEATLRVIDVPKTTDGKVLKIFMNADLDEAVGILTQPEGVVEKLSERPTHVTEQPSEEHWRWRLRMAERIAEQMDPERFGVKGFYVFGSTKNGTASYGSDIDLLLHVDQTPEQNRDMMSWLEGWSRALDEMNYLRTGYRAEELLDVHLVTDSDIEHRSSYAVKIGAVTDAAREIKVSKKISTVSIPKTND